MKKQELSLLVKVKCSSTNKKGMAKTYVLLKLKDETSCFLGYLMPKDHWNAVTKKCNEDYPDHQSVNQEIDKALELLKAYYLVLSATNENVTAEDLKKAYKANSDKKGASKTESEEDHPEIEKTLLSIADKFIKEFEEMVKVGDRSPETLKQWNSTREKIVEFANYYYKKDDIVLSKITTKFGDELYRYLTIKRTEFNQHLSGKRRKENVEEAYARKQLKNIKQLLDIAVKEKLFTENPLEDCITYGGDKEVIPLELHEVDLIHAKPIDIQRLDEVRDAYVFQCFTGFAYCDLYALTPEHIVYVGINRDPWLVKERGKTKVNQMVPLLPIVLEIINKYKDHPYCVANNKLIPVDSNSKYNAYLKELAVICGISRELKTHLARHTFADIMLNVCDFALEDVSKMLGHKSIRTTMRYCRVRKERIARRMKAAFSVLFDTAGRLKLSSVA